MKIKLMIPFIILLGACGGGGGGGGGNGNNDDDDDDTETPSGGWGSPVRLSAETGISALDVSLALDPDGNAVAVWQQHVFADDVGQVAASYRLSGQDWSTPETIHGFDSFHSEVPQVKFDVDGNATAIWFQGVTDPSEQGLVRANRYVPGMGWQGAATLEEYTTRGTITPQLSLLTSGNALAVWSSQNDNAVWTCLYSSGNWCADPDAIDDSVDKVSAFSTQVAADDLGNAVAVWLQQEEDSVDGLADVMASRYNGMAWSAAVRLEGSISMDSYNPKIGMDSAGNAIAIWQVFEVDGAKIYSNRYASAWGEPELLGAGAWPELAVSANGSAFAVWRSSDTNLSASVFTPASGWSDPVTIDAGSGQIDYQRVAANDFGDAFVVWTQASDGQDNIWASHYEAGAGWSGAMLVEQLNASGAYRPVVVIDNNNNAIAAWDYFTGSGNQVWANRYTSN